jgi:RNA polymerase sigma-70 factor (ECF subfamily)
VIVEGFPPIGTQPAGVQLNFVALGLMLAGFLVGWKREGTAALLIGCGWVLWHASEGRIDWNFFQTPLPVAALYGFCWWATREKRTVALVGTTGGLALALLGGMLFLPTSVHVRGLVTDASTGRPIRDAKVELGNLGAVPDAVPVLSSMTSDFRGLYALYVGWYRETMALSVSAPGYVRHVTKLGARPLGSRRLVRDVVLEPMGIGVGTEEAPSEGPPASVTTAPPVVLRTVPVSGESDVDASLVELSVTFSKPMLDGHWSWSTWSPETFPEMAGQPRYDTDGRTCVLPVRLVPGRMYVIWLNSDNHHGFRDQEGRAAVPYLLTFKTRD